MFLLQCYLSFDLKGINRPLVKLLHRFARDFLMRTKEMEVERG